MNSPGEGRPVLPSGAGNQHQLRDLSSPSLGPWAPAARTKSCFPLLPCTHQLATSQLDLPE